MEHEKIKIVELIPELMARRGAEVFFFSLVQEMSKCDDVELHVVLFYKVVDPSFKELLDNPRIQVHIIGKRKGIDLRCASAFKRLIKELSPDVINGHLTYLLTYCLAFGNKKQRFPLVHTVHSVDEGRKSLVLKRFLARRGSIAFIGISPIISKQITAAFPHARTKTIFNGIAESKYPRNSFETAKPYDFIIVASLTEVKNHALLFDALKQYSGIFGQSNLLVVGDGPLLEVLKEQASSLDLKNSITFAGNQNDVYACLNQAKVFVLSSKYEGNPISILEAMNAGLPIVAPSVGGIPDVVSDGENGFLFPPENLSSLVQSMRRAILAYEKGEMRANNLLKAESFYIPNVASEYISFFREIIKNDKNELN